MEGDFLEVGGDGGTRYKSPFGGVLHTWVTILTSVSWYIIDMVYKYELQGVKEWSILGNIIFSII